MKYFLILSLFFIPKVYAWDGYGTDGHNIEIEKGTYVRDGENIEIYDYEEGRYKNITVEKMSSSGSTTEIEAYDNDSGEYITYEMND